MPRRPSLPGWRPERPGHRRAAAPAEASLADHLKQGPFTHRGAGRQWQVMVGMHHFYIVRVVPDDRAIRPFRFRVGEDAGQIHSVEIGGDFVANELITKQTDGRCYVTSAECAEHGANSAIYTLGHGTLVTGWGD